MRKWFLLLLIPIFAVIVGAGWYVVANATPGDTLVLADYFEVSYEGYNNSGKVRMVRKDDMLFDEVDAIRLEQKEALIANKAVANDEYLQFAAGIAAMIDNNENLTNGDEFTVSYLYDKELAKRLRINVDDSESSHKVEGLTNASPLTADDLFEDLSVEFSGVSPNVELTITNNSTNPLIQSLVFKPVEYKETYTAGETVTIRCYFNENERLSDFYYITTPAEECVRDYVVDGTEQYVTSLDQIPSEIITEAIAEGRKAFVDANEYGVRIFCEAHLVPVYINQQATFRYGNPSLIAAYFKSVNPEEAGKNGNDYNTLDLIYSVSISQADGVSCKCEAVVRFNNFIQNTDGSISYDFSDPSIMSASYSNSSIHKNVVTRYEGTYNIEKLDINKY